MWCNFVFNGCWVVCYVFGIFGRGYCFDLFWFDEEGDLYVVVIIKWDMGWMYGVFFYWLWFFVGCDEIYEVWVILWYRG